VIRFDEPVTIGRSGIDAQNQQNRECLGEMGHHGLSPDAGKIPAKQKQLSQGRL
jgi:hypothetical protein